MLSHMEEKHGIGSLHGPMVAGHGATVPGLVVEGHIDQL